MVIDMVGSSYLLLNLSGPNFKAGLFSENQNVFNHMIKTSSYLLTAILYPGLSFPLGSTKSMSTLEK